MQIQNLKRHDIATLLRQIKASADANPHNRVNFWGDHEDGVPVVVELDGHTRDGAGGREAIVKEMADGLWEVLLGAGGDLAAVCVDVPLGCAHSRIKTSGPRSSCELDSDLTR